MRRVETVNARMSTPGSRLRAKIALLHPQMQASAAKVWDHPRLAQIFPDYLCEVHAAIRATVPMLRRASSCAQALAESDPVAARLADYFAEHADEEVGHDDWLLDDIEALGVPRGDVLGRVPSPAVAALVGPQYYWIENHHPIAHLGYLAVLERPGDPEFYRELIRRTGLPADAFRTLIHHAELDGEHVDELYSQIDSLPMEPAHERMLGISAITTAGAMAAVFEEFVRDREPAR